MWQRKKVQTVLRPLRAPRVEQRCLQPQRSWISPFVLMSFFRGLWPVCGVLSIAFLAAAFPSYGAYIHTNLAPPTLQREFRGAWVATLNNIDWPSKPGLPTEEQKRELVRIIERAAQIHLNAILF